MRSTSNSSPMKQQGQAVAGSAVTHREHVILELEADGAVAITDYSLSGPLPEQVTGIGHIALGDDRVYLRVGRLSPGSGSQRGIKLNVGVRCGNLRTHRAGACGGSDSFLVTAPPWVRLRQGPH